MCCVSRCVGRSVGWSGPTGWAQGRLSHRAASHEYECLPRNMASPLEPPSTPGVTPYTDRVIVEHLRAQAAAADRKVLQQMEAVLEEGKRRERSEEEVEKLRRENTHLLSEIASLKTKLHDEQRARTGATRVGKNLIADLEQCKKQRDYWQEQCQRAVGARDTALTTAIALRDCLRSPTLGGDASSEAVALLRAQLIQCRSRKEQHKQRALSEGNRADSLQLRCDTLEREVAALRREVTGAVPRRER